jgi:tetratricopeptide (TPR) repeat protein
MRRADLLITLNQDRAGYAAWQRAVALTEAQQLTSREALQIKTQYLFDTADVPAAETASRAFALHYPNDWLPSFLLGVALVQLDRTEEAVQSFERARQLAPSALQPAVHLANVYLDLGRLEDAARTGADLEALGARDWAIWIRALAKFSAGDVDGALAGLEPLKASADVRWQSRLHGIRAAWLAEAGRDQEALDEINLGVVFDLGRGFREQLSHNYLHKAELEARLGEMAAASEDAEKALEAAGSARLVARVGGLLARLGQIDRARGLFAKFDEFAAVRRTEVARHLLGGEILLAEGNAPEAVAELEIMAGGAAQGDSRLALARALARVGERTRALRLLEHVVDHPVRMYAAIEADGVGVWRQAIHQLEDLNPRAELSRKYPALSSVSTSPGSFTRGR